MKYRLWCKDKNEWEKDNWVILPNGDLMWVEYRYLVSGVYMKNHILVKSTGVKDIEGKEIYEGDIIKYWDSFYDDYKLAVVEFYKSTFIIKNHRIEWHIGQMDEFDEMEVVGNIYENKDLIEED